jgi:hypothetical protein
MASSTGSPLPSGARLRFLAGTDLKHLRTLASQLYAVITIRMEPPRASTELPSIPAVPHAHRQHDPDMPHATEHHLHPRCNRHAPVVRELPLDAGEGRQHE